MLLDQAALCKQAAIFESLELKENNFHPSFMSELETLLLDVYSSLLPNSNEYEQRKQLVQAFNMSAKNIFGDTEGFPEVVAFGSFIMNIFTAKSDLDLSVNFSSGNAALLPRAKVVSILRRFTKVLKEERSKGNLSGVLFVRFARVPVLKAVDCKTGIECDISVENKDGISRSLFYSVITSIDERFRIMSYLMKAWAKANNINSSRYHTMNSLSIISLVALHFQTRDPPILPPFSTLLRDGIDMTNLPSVTPELTEFAKRNKESVAELFVSLLAKLTSVEKLWELGLCASNFEGSWISKTSNTKNSGIINVEDFLDRSQNFARSVCKSKMPKIYNTLRGSLGYLMSSMNGQIEMPTLGTLLFGSLSLHTKYSYTNTGMIINQKLPIVYIQPHVDVIDQNNQASDTAGKRHKRKNASTKNLKSKPPSNVHMESVAPKRPRHNSNAAAALDLGSHENQNYIYFPTPVIYPAPSYVQTLPFNMAVGLHEQIRHPSTNHLPLSWHHQPALHYHYPPIVPEPSRMHQYFPNPVHPSMLPGYPMYDNNDVRHPQYFVPPMPFGSNHPWC